MHSALPWLGLLMAFGLARAEPAPAAALALDSHRSDAEFEVHPRLPFRGIARFNRMKGQLSGDPAGWQVALQVDGRSLHFEGPGWMDQLTRSSSFLNVDRYPAIALRTRTIPDQVLRHGGAVQGELTLRGRTRPASFVLLPPTCARPGLDCDLLVQGTVSRRDFGMTAYRLALRDGVDVRVRLRWQEAPKP